MKFKWTAICLASSPVILMLSWMLTGIGERGSVLPYFEPNQTVEEVIKILDEAKVMHDTIRPNTYVMSNGKNWWVGLI